MNKLIAASAIALATLTTAGFGQVVNPGFEFGTPYLGSPLQMNQWGYDSCAFVPAEFGVTPASGQQMLKAIATGPGGAGGVVSDIFQILDLTAPAYQSAITAGGAIANASVLTNRLSSTVAFNIDTRCDIRVYSHTSLANAQVLSSTASTSSTIFTDNNQATWEAVSASLALPTSTQYVTIHLAFVENVMDDNVFNGEFRGNYMDDVTFSLVPAPGAFALAGLGGMLTLRRRR